MMSTNPMPSDWTAAIHATTMFSSTYLKLNSASNKRVVAAGSLAAFSPLLLVFGVLPAAGAARQADFDGNPGGGMLVAKNEMLPARTDAESAPSPRAETETRAGTSASRSAGGVRWNGESNSTRPLVGWSEEKGFVRRIAPSKPCTATAANASRAASPWIADVAAL